MSDKIAMVVFSHYPQDPRVRREAEALSEAGMKVDVFCLRAVDSKPREVVNGVRVYRLPIRESRTGKLNYIYEYAAFFLLAAMSLTFFHLVRRYKIVHVHNMPDLLVLTALVPRLTGAKVILDLHDPMPEVYMTKYSLEPNHPIVWLLCFCERLSTGFANQVLTPNITFRERFISRGCPAGKIDIVMNSPQEEVFLANKDTPVIDESKFVIMFHGVINERSGLHKAIEAIGMIRDKIPNMSFNIYGSGEFIDYVLKRADELKLNDIVRFHGCKSQEELVPEIKSITVGIIPNINSPFTNINLPTRIMEYMCLNKPVIAPSTQGILDYFNEECLYLFKAGDVQNLADVLLDVYENPEKRQKIAHAGAQKYIPYRWAQQKRNLVDIVSNLLKAKRQVVYEK